MSSPSIRELRCDLGEDEIIRRHDEAAKATEVGVAYYLDELRRRESRQHDAIMQELASETAEINRKMHKLTCWMTGLTFLVAVLTVINLVLALRISGD